MRDFKRLMKRTTFLKLFASYSLILILLVMILFNSYYYSTVKYYQDEINVSILNRLLVVENSIDALFEEITRNAFRLSRDDRINAAYKTEDISSIKDGDTILKLQDTLGILEEIEGISSVIQSVYLYNPDSQLVYKSRGGIYPVDEFKDIAWLGQIVEDGYKKYLLSPREVQNQNGDILPERVFSLAYSLSVYPYVDKINLVINLNEPSLYKYISSIREANSGSIMLFDKEGELFVSQKEESRILLDDSIESIGDKLANLGGRGHFSYKQGEEEFLITYSEGNQLTYVGITPMSEVFSHIQMFKNTLFLITIILLLVGLVVIYYISSKFYSPIGGILKKLKATEDMEGMDDKDDLRIISNSIEHIIEKNKQMHEESKKKTNELNDTGIRNLINGYVTEDAYDKFEYKYIQCLVLNIDNYDSFLNKYASSEQYYLKTFVIKAYEKILARSNVIAHGLILEGQELMLLINHNERNPLVLYDELCDSHQKLLAQIGDQLSVSVGVGEVYGSIEDAALSYKQALESLKYKFIKGRESIIFSKDLEIRFSDDNITYLIDRDKVILDALKINNIEKIEKELKEMTREIYENESISYEGVMQRIYLLISGTVSFLLDNNIRIEDAWGESHSIYHKVAEFETLDELELFLLRFYTSVGDYLEKEDQEDDTHLVRIIDYIDENYKLNHMSIDRVSEATSLSYSHVRKIFKDAKGINITEYINELRIREAKKMLLETDLTIMKISEAVGYTSDRSFRRTFKNYENITPGEFRSRFKTN